MKFGKFISISRLWKVSHDSSCPVYQMNVFIPHLPPHGDWRDPDAFAFLPRVIIQYVREGDLLLKNNLLGILEGGA